MSRSMRLRGLASLIPDGAFELEAPTKNKSEEKGVRSVPIDLVKPNPEQPRTVFDKEALQSLADSITRHGVLNPIVVRKEGGSYILIAGERRLRASGLAGLSEIPIILREVADGQTQLELALVENLQRADLDAIESAKGFARLIELYGYTQEQVAKAVSKNRATIANLVRLLKHPQFVLDAVRDGRITAGHARTLLPLADREEELRMTLAKVIAQSLSVRATERLVSDKVRVAPPVQARGTSASSRDNTMRYATRLLEESLHTAVRIQTSKSGNGKIVIDFADGEDLERLIGLLREE